MESLLSAATPEIPESDERLVLHNLVASGFIKDNRQGCTCLLDNPASSSLEEGDTLESLRIICGQVLSAANIARPFVELGLGNLATLESEPTISSHPYAYLRLSTSSFEPDPEREHRTDVMMPIEFKKGLEGAGCSAGLRKVVCQMLYIVRSEPRRRFVFGLDIKNTSARFWFYDRCDIVASEIFDIQKDWKTLARLFLRLASASFEELGYDSRCRAVRTELYCYDFVFDKDEDGKPVETVYPTVDVIYDLGATSLLGHGIRVWKVQKVVNGQPIDGFYALKDVWRYVHREPEHAIVQKIRVAQPEHTYHFLAVGDAEFVPTLKDGQVSSDHTLDVVRRGRYFLATGVELNTLPARSESGIPSETTSGGHRDAKYLNQYPRRQSRMVNREVGTSIYNMRHFPDALRAIQGASKGLYAMHLMGFNHCNVSAGNIIYYNGPDDHGGRGIIMDLEYATEHNSESGSCNGTPEFMAVEASYEGYAFDPLYEEIDEIGITATTSRPPFRQNSLHDYESTWWIAVWLLFTLFEPKRIRTGEYISNYEELFESSADTRWLFWDRAWRFQSLSQHLVSTSEKRCLARMRIWAKELNEMYEKSYLAGKYQELAPTTVEGAHQLGLKRLEELISIVSTYPDNLVFLSDLEDTPPAPELSMASLNLGPGHKSSAARVETD